MALSAKDLRIGNIIQKNGKIHYTNIFTIRDIKNLSIDDTDNFEPIPINEDWLLKFGFNTQYKKGWIGIDVKHENGTTTDFVLSYPQRMGMWQTFFAFEYDSFRFVDLQYVHQLQNLYFALTGEDLVFSTEP